MRDRTARWSPECTLMISSSVTGRHCREGGREGGRGCKGEWLGEELEKEWVKGREEKERFKYTF